MKGVMKVIKKLKGGKSDGQDKITRDMMKNLGCHGRNILIKVFNLAWSTGEMPKGKEHWYNHLIT